MKATLWIELGQNRSAFAIENEKAKSLQYVDLTGGYGMVQVPFKIAYLDHEEDVLCGEEALAFGPAVWAGESVQTTYDFLHKCITKIAQQYHDLKITSIALINAAEFTWYHCDGVQAQLTKTQYTEVQWISMKEAFVGYGYQKQLHDATFVYFNGSWSACFDFREQDILKETVREVNKNSIALDAIDKFYLSRLKEEHEKIYGLEIDIQSLMRTYEDQKLLLYRQIQQRQDVHLYTSIQYPPKKITIKYADFDMFFKQWLSESLHMLKIQNDTIWIGGGYNQECFWKQLLAEYKGDYDEHMLIKGAIAFVEYRKTHKKDLCTTTKTHWGYAILDHNNHRVPFILPGEKYQNPYIIDIVLTNYQRSVPFLQLDEKLNEKHLFNLYIHPENATTHIEITLEISIEGQIEEVKYEYRTL
jgi:hypothetical protein